MYIKGSPVFGGAVIFCYFVGWSLPRIFTGFSNLPLPKGIGKPTHVTTTQVKVSMYQLVPASTQHLGNGDYSSEPFQARS